MRTGTSPKSTERSNWEVSNRWVDIDKGVLFACEAEPVVRCRWRLGGDLLKKYSNESENSIPALTENRNLERDRGKMESQPNVLKQQACEAVLRARSHRHSLSLMHISDGSVLQWTISVRSWRRSHCRARDSASRASLAPPVPLFYLPPWRSNCKNYLHQRTLC